jgi:hypothetical protein
MKKPVPIVILSALAMLNGVVAFALGVMTLRGGRILFTPGGYGDDRIAISQLFGSLAHQSGWIVLVIGGLFILIGYGLFTLRQWARLIVFWVFAVVAAVTLMVVVRSVCLRQIGVVLSGLLKIAFEVALCRYLTTPKVRSAFSN